MRTVGVKQHRQDVHQSLKCISLLGGDEKDTVTLEERSITMAFAGDMMFEQHLLPLAQDPDSLSELKDTLGAADLSVANMETAITESGTPWPGKPFTFHAPEGAIDAAVGAGIDALTMANNHAFDYGKEVAKETLQAKKDASIPIVGIGNNEDESYKPATLEANGMKVAVLGASQIDEETLNYRSATEDEYGIAACWRRRA